MSGAYSIKLTNQIKNEGLKIECLNKLFNSFFEQKYTPKQTYEELMEYYNLVKKYNGIFISIWHNHMLGTTEQFTGWRQMFELFMKETVYWDAYYDEG